MAAPVRGGVRQARHGAEMPRWILRPGTRRAISCVREHAIDANVPGTARDGDDVFGRGAGVLDPWRTSMVLMGLAYPAPPRAATRACPYGTRSPRGEHRSFVLDSTDGIVSSLFAGTFPAQPIRIACHRDQDARSAYPAPPQGSHKGVPLRCASGVLRDGWETPFSAT